MSERISAGREVRLAYRLLDEDGRLLEERTPDAPAVYVHGRSELLPALERELEGRTAGYRATVALEPKDAYGDYDPELLVEVPRDRFPAGVDLSPGAKFSTQGPDGRPIAVRVLDSDEATVSLDGNHPLAGLKLTFELAVLEVGDGADSGGPSSLH